MIEVTTRTDRSFGMATLQTLVRPFRPMLVKPGKPTSAGSNQLDVHRSAKRHFRVEERQVEGIWVYDIVPKTTKESKGGAAHKKRIY